MTRRTNSTRPRNLHPNMQTPPAPPDQEPATTAPPLLLAELSSPAFAEAAKRIELVLIPIGAHEQHGPALPFSTDTIAAQVLGGLAGALLGPRVAIAPTIPFGVSWSHLGFPGTISLREETLMSVVEDVVLSLHQHGIERFMLVNTHGGNNATLEIVAERCHRDHGVPIVASIYAYSLIANAANDSLGEGSIGHAGGDESAVVLATRPDLVDKGQLGARKLNADIRQVQAIVRAAGGVLPIAMHKTAYSGASGDSTNATAEAGAEIIGKAAGQLRAIAEAIMDLDIAEFR